MVPKEAMETYLIKQVVTKSSNADSHLEDAIKDSLKTFNFLPFNRKKFRMLSERGQDQAIEVFADNLSKLITTTT